MSITGRIAGVAIRYGGLTYTLPEPNRHHHLIRMIGGISGPHNEGFYDDSGLFLTRTEAFLRAKETGQLIRDPSPLKYQGPELFSEDLW